MPDKQPVAPIDEDERYALTTEVEVCFMLQQMLRRGEVFTVYFNQGRDFILTSLLAIEKRQFVFDVGAEANTNQRLAQAKKLIFVAAPDGIRVQFSVSGAQNHRFGDHPAFCAALPEAVMKLQRREFFRVETPLSLGLRIVLPEAHAGQRLTLALRNLGVGGAGVELPGLPSEFHQLQKFVGAWVDLRSEGRIHTDMEVRHITSMRGRGNSFSIMGLQFCHMNKTDQARLQRFLVYLERERRQFSL